MRPQKLALVHFEQTLKLKKEELYIQILKRTLDASSFYEPYRNEILGYLRSRRYDLLLDKADALGDTEYDSPAQHYAVHQLVALIKKYPFFGPIPGVDPEKKAIEKFHEAERRCGRYNLIFRLERKLGRRRLSFLREYSRDWIRMVIGEEPNYSAIWPLCSFGPGASVGVSGNATHLAAKFLSPRWSVTPAALPFALAAMRSNPHIMELVLSKDGSLFCLDPEAFDLELRQRVEMVTYNKITLVPKTAKVHRTIAVEPLLNSFVQLGVCEFFRRRLLKFGIDLKDQSRNQRYAYYGSLPGEDPLASIDLSSASDSISVELARDILPPAWFSFLNAIRSPAYKLGGTISTYHKFVSMGNGFCFPLETLIFTSICVAVHKMHHRSLDSISVYGDDILVRSSLAPDVLKALRALGFRHNPDKTFVSGPFRESCGADWFNGEDVRPITLDYHLETLGDLFKFHNLTLRKNKSASLFSAVREYIRGLVPPKLRLVRPYQGDVSTAFEVEQDEFMASRFSAWNRKTFSWSWTELVAQAVSDNSLSDKHGWSTVLMMAALRGSSSKSPFTKRRNTRTRVRIISHHGGFSTWLPSP